MKAAGLAAWCVSTGFPPELYRALSVLERDEFMTAAKKFHGGK